jgi:hypothetical protein
MRRLCNRRCRARIPDLVAQEFLGQTLRAAITRSSIICTHVLGISCLPLLSGGRGFGRRLRRFLECSLGGRSRSEISTYGRVCFSAFAWHLLSSDHTISRFSALRRRIQGNGFDGRPSRRKIVRLLQKAGSSSGLEFFRHHRAQSGIFLRHRREDIPYQWMNGSPKFGDLFSPALEHLVGPRRAPRDRPEGRHNDIARSGQAMYEAAKRGLRDYS